MEGENNGNTSEELVTLEIEDTSIPCKKCLLIENSEYFRAMFSGNFLESHQNTVKLEGVDAKSLNTILTLLWDHTYTVKEEDLLPLVHASLMLQFNKIKDICEERILETLKPSNCLRIWQQLDQQVSPLDVKAKCMALEEFSVIWKTDQILVLNVDEICTYLGHTSLKTENEFDVFQAAMKWWYENEKTYENSNATDLILRLLYCLDFKNLTKENIQEMKTYPDIFNNSDGEITNLLDCILHTKEKSDLTSYSEKHQKLALKLLNDSKSRRMLLSPCVVLDKGTQKLFKESKSEGEIGVVLYRDKFGRKRKYDTVSAKDERMEMGFFNHCSNMLGLSYDWQENGFTEFFLIPENKVKGMAGFELLGYKEFILLFGGELTIGMGNWNMNLWMYDTFREKWERRGVIKYPRRHFESCIAGNTLYIVGGTGKYRVLQDNLFYYNFKDDEWSVTYPLPCSSRQIKCCSYKENLFVLSLPKGCGYLFDKGPQGLQGVQTYRLVLEKSLTDELENYHTFFWNDHFYIVGNSLYKFKFEETNLILVESWPHLTSPTTFYKAVLCNDLLFTLGNDTNENSLANEYVKTILNLHTLESETTEMSMMLENGTDEIKNLPCSISKLFAFHHYERVRENILVNDL